MREEGINIRQTALLSWRIGLTYTGTVVGAGFASGQEVLQFFTLYGKYGFWGILLSTLLFSWLGVRMMLIGARMNADSYKELNTYLFGSYWGKWVNHFITLMLFGLTTAMISGAGSLFSEHVGISFHIGVGITIACVYIVLIHGLQGIMSVNSIIVPIMFVFIVLIGIYAWLQGDWAVAYDSISIETHRHWLISAFTYASFNLAMAQSVLVPLGAEVKREKAIRLGGWIGGILLGLMLWACNYAMQLRIEEVLHMEIPMALLVSSFGIFVKYLFLILIWAEILSTMISNMYGLTSSFKQYSSLSPQLIMGLIFLFGYLFSMIGFPTLVRYLYPVFGYCGMVIIWLLIWRNVPRTR